MSESFTLDGVEGASFDDIPVGSYVGIIENTVVSPSSKGTPGLRVQFKIVDGEHKGRVISDWLYFTQGAAPFVAGKLDAAGVDRPTGLTTGEQWAERLRDTLGGHYAEIIVRPDEYKGGSATKVSAWKTPPAEYAGRKPAPSAGGGAAPADDDIPF